jgi:hypothetical protein
MEFKSPASKVVKFLKEGREGWKAKCQEAKRGRKLCANQARAVEKSRDRWKQVAKAAQRRVHELEQQMERLKCNAPRAARPSSPGIEQSCVVGGVAGSTAPVSHV